MKLTHSGLMRSLVTVSIMMASACSSHSQATSLDSHAISTSVDCGGKHDLHGAGSTVQKLAIEQFGYAYAAACPGYMLEYTANGSSTGLDSFIANEADLAGSDAPIDQTKVLREKAVDRCGSPVWNVPMIFDPIAVTYHLPGVDTLNLDGVTLARIFSGAIDTWDHPLIKALNSRITLPSLPIHLIYRSDKSNTTLAFQRYLDWVTDGGWGGASDVFIGGYGEPVSTNASLISALRNTDGAISYTDWSEAVSHRLPMVQLVTAANADPVGITADSVRRTIAGAQFSGQGNDLIIDPTSLYKNDDAAAYPIVLPTYEIVCSKYPDPAIGVAVKAFMQAALGSAQAGLDQYGAIPLPEAFKDKILNSVNAIK